MLDLDDPQTPYIFGAAFQLGLVFDYCKTITTGESYEERHRMVESMRPAFAALRWLNREKFSSSSEIASAIDAFESKVDELAAIPCGRTPRPFNDRVAICPCCNQGLRVPDQYESKRYCVKCFDVVIESHERCCEVFGADAI